MITIQRRLQALEAKRIQGHRGVVVVGQGETPAQALDRVQPAGPYILVPAKRLRKEPLHGNP